MFFQHKPHFSLQNTPSLQEAGGNFSVELVKMNTTEKSMLWKNLDVPYSTGAGDLLGSSQSGFIADVSFEVCCKMVEEVVEEVKYNDFQHIFPKSSAQKSEVNFVLLKSIVKHFFPLIMYKMMHIEWHYIPGLMQ